MIFFLWRQYPAKDLLMDHREPRDKKETQKISYMDRGENVYFSSLHYFCLTHFLFQVDWFKIENFHSNLKNFLKFLPFSPHFSNFMWFHWFLWIFFFLICFIFFWKNFGLMKSSNDGTQSNLQSLFLGNFWAKSNNEHSWHNLIIHNHNDWVEFKNFAKVKYLLDCRLLGFVYDSIGFWECCNFLIKSDYLYSNLNRVQFHLGISIFIK